MIDPFSAPSEGFIGGKWVSGSGGTFEVRSPHSRQLIGVVSRGTVDDVGQAVAVAREAQPSWTGLPVIERVQFLRRVHQLFLERAEPIAEMLSLEIGETITESRHEVDDYAAPAYAKAAEEILRHRAVTFPFTREQTSSGWPVLGHRPLGVVGVVTPYSFPTGTASVALAHIVGVGNTVVWKPSEYAPYSCAMVARIFDDAGLPPGVVNVVHGFGDVGTAIAEHVDVNGIFFAGSTRSAQSMARSSPSKRTLLGLGGAGPFIILSDADVDAAVLAVISGCFYFAGQLRTSCGLVLLHEDVFDDFIAKLTAAATNLVIGNPSHESTSMGPLCNEVALARVRQHVSDAVGKGAEMIQFGPEEGLYFPATILIGMTEDMHMMREETSGPVVPVMKISSAREAVGISKRGHLGTVASVWTRDPATAWRVAEALPHASVNVNEASNYLNHLAPFGAVQGSGVGIDLSQCFLESFTERKLIVLELGDSNDRDARLADHG